MGEFLQNKKLDFQVIVAGTSAANRRHCWSNWEAGTLALHNYWMDCKECREVSVSTDGEPTFCELAPRSPRCSAGKRTAQRAMSTMDGYVREKALAGRAIGSCPVASMVHLADGFTPRRQWKGLNFGVNTCGFETHCWSESQSSNQHCQIVHLPTKIWMRLSLNSRVPGSPRGEVNPGALRPDRAPLEAPARGP